MSLNISVTAGHNFPADTPVTLEALRQAALPSVSFTGSVATADLANGAVTAPKSTPGPFWYADATYTTNAYASTLGVTGLVDGLEVWIKTPNSSDNTASATLNVDSKGAKTIYKQNGEVLIPGDMRSNRIYGFRYNTTLGGWQLFTPVANAHRAVTTTGTDPNYIWTGGATPNCPTVTTLSALQGVPIYFKANFTNSGAATLKVDAMDAKSIRKRGDLPLEGGEIKMNQTVAVLYDAYLNSAAGGFMLLTSPDQPIVPAMSRNLRIIRNATHPDHQVDIDADYVTVESAKHDKLVLTNINLTLDIAGSLGPLGLDIGTEAINTKYYLWVLWNGTDISGMFSTSGTAPDLTNAGSFIYHGLVGAVYNNASSNFDRHWEYGEHKRFVSEEVALQVGTDGVIVNNEHDLGAAPRRVHGYMVCTSAELGYSVGDRVDLISAVESSNMYHGFVIKTNATYLSIIRHVQVHTLILENDTGYSWLDIDSTKWAVFAVAEL